MRLFLVFCFFVAVSTGFAQERCVTAEYIKLVRQAAPSANGVQHNNIFSKKVTEDLVIRIPVIVHVLYNNSNQNISDAEIISGLQALNRDFRRRNADTVNTPERFRHLAADVQIEFFLARSGPQGGPTTGIERKASSRNVWVADDRMKQASIGGMDTWDSRSYLNIWVCNLGSGSGYATMPGSDPQTDGVVIHFNAFGTINAAPPFNMGRTLVHEVGHWLGLKHIWGDTQCGDDGVDDTPQQSFYTKGCPTMFRSSCNNGTDGDMYMNYMDYTNDACMNLFTRGQRQHMRSAFYAGGPRGSLLQSRGLEAPWMTELPTAVPETAVYPNPARTSLTLQTEAGLVGKNVTLLNSQGQIIRTERITSTSQVINLQTVKPGVYFLKGEGFLHKFVRL